MIKSLLQTEYNSSIIMYIVRFVIQNTRNIKLYQNFTL